MITFVNYSTRTIIFGPAYGTTYKNNALRISALSTNRVPPCGIEPQPSEPESEILSIKLRRQNHRKKEAFPNRTANIVQFPFISPFFLYFCDRNPYPQPHADTGNSEY